MKKVLKERVLPVVAALLTAFVVMMVFEYTNSHFFPLPDELDWKDQDAVVVFTDSLPWTAYILVLLGWVVGSFAAGYLAARLGKKEDALRHSLVVGGILAFLGLVNNTMLGHSILFNVCTLPLFVVCAYMGQWYHSHKTIQV